MIRSITGKRWILCLINMSTASYTLQEEEEEEGEKRHHDYGIRITPSSLTTDSSAPIKDTIQPSK